MEIATDIEIQANNNSSFNIYPNPSSHNLNIVFSKANIKQLQLSIKNNLGQVIYTASDSNTGNEYKKTIDLSKESKGIYFIEVIVDVCLPDSQGEKYVRKVILN
ncbi:MAG: T9SS type A sorting domain-containing protein [Bacteroidetes bacterium]|nr:T9SS type A sorting domain-containing protein [Bacteroidota bacterium]